MRRALVFIFSDLSPAESAMLFGSVPVVLLYSLHLGVSLVLASFGGAFVRVLPFSSLVAPEDLAGRIVWLYPEIVGRLFMVRLLGVGYSLGVPLMVSGLVVARRFYVARAHMACRYGVGPVGLVGVLLLALLPVLVVGLAGVLVFGLVSVFQAGTGGGLVPWPVTALVCSMVFFVVVPGLVMGFSGRPDLSVSAGLAGFYVVYRLAGSVEIVALALAAVSVVAVAAGVVAAWRRAGWP